PKRASKTVCVERFANELANDVHDRVRCRDDRHVVDELRAYAAANSFSHKALRVADDHAILLRHKEPGGPIFPEWPAQRHGDTRWRNWPLNGNSTANSSAEALSANTAAKASYGG